MLCASKQFLIYLSFICLPIILPNVDGLIVNPEQAAQAGKIGEGGPVPGEDKVALGQYDAPHIPVPGEDGRGDAVGGSLLRLHQPPSRSLLSHYS